MEQINKTLTSLSPKLLNSLPVNSSINKSLSTVNSSKTVNSIENQSRKISEFLENESITLEGIALSLAEGLDDHKSIKYFRLLVRENPPGKLFLALSIVNDAARSGKLRRRKIHYFLWLLKRWGLKTKFRVDTKGK